MADLVSMKLTAAEKKERDSGMLASPSYEGEQYPWGLSLNLEHEALKKLGIKGLTAGQELTLIAKVKVTSASSYSTEGQEDRASASLQITEMSLDMPRAFGSRLYPDEG